MCSTVLLRVRVCLLPAWQARQGGGPPPPQVSGLLVAATPAARPACWTCPACCSPVKHIWCCCLCTLSACLLHCRRLLVMAATQAARSAAGHPGPAPCREAPGGLAWRWHHSYAGGLVCRGRGGLVTYERRAGGGNRPCRIAASWQHCRLYVQVGVLASKSRGLAESGIQELAAAGSWQRLALWGEPSLPVTSATRCLHTAVSE